MDAKAQIDRIFDHYKSTPSDINEHLETLYNYTKQCSSVIELGVREIVSTWAFIKGLAEVEGEKRLYSVDIDKCENINAVIQIADAVGVKMTFHHEDSSKVELPRADLLFIDTLHVYGHLRRELEHHHHRAKKFIVMHDTEGDAIFGEAIRSNWNLLTTMKKTGYSFEDITHGLLRAIYEFLHNHPEWRIEYIALNNNGLMVLRRIDETNAFTKLYENIHHR
jgi:hypothetical protein